MTAKDRLDLIEKLLRKAARIFAVGLLAGGAWVGRYDVATYGGVLYLIFRD